MKTVFSILLLLSVSAIGSAQDNKEGAKSFFKTIVKTYFDKDCDKYYSLFNDTISIVSPYGQEIFAKNIIDTERKTCDKFEQFTEGLNSFQQYADEYRFVVLNKKEFTSRNDDSVINQIAAENTNNILVYEILEEYNRYYTDQDFLVFGNIHKTNSAKNISKGLFWFIVRKTKQGWKIFGTKS
jgi:hypothetical protein